MVILLSDIIDLDITHEDKNEKFVDSRKYIDVDETRSQIASRSDYFSYVRESVLHKLYAANYELPKGYTLCLKEGYRSKERQEKSFQKVFDEYRIKHKNKNYKEIIKLVSEYVAPIEVAGHPTGGAVDVVLLRNGKEVWMGTKFNDEPSGTENRTYTNSVLIDEEARRNRQILIRVMEIKGFINYPAEWWHWSFGDKYWAFINKCSSFYLSANENELSVMEKINNITLEK